MSKGSWVARCKSISNSLGYGVSFITDANRDKKPFIDDGTLHVRRCGVRACFDVACDVERIQNDRVREIMKELRLSVTKSVLIDEPVDYVEEETTCGWCGR